MERTECNELSSQFIVDFGESTWPAKYDKRAVSPQVLLVQGIRFIVESDILVLLFPLHNYDL